MSRRKLSLREVAPAEPACFEPAETTWLLNLDQIEANTGRLISKQIVRTDSAGSSTHLFDKGNVLYSKLRPYLNKVFLPDEVGLCTSELVPMRPRLELITREYLAAYLRSPKFLEWVSHQIDGAKMPRVSMKTFWEHELNLPPLEEQKRIAAILDKADSLRRKRRQAIRLADDFLRAVFLDMFGDPVTNPKGWQKKRLGEVTKFLQTGPFGSLLHQEDYICGGIPLVNPKHIVQGVIRPDPKETVGPSKHEELRSFHLREGDVVMGRRGEMGRCAIVSAEQDGFLCGTGSMIIRPDVGAVKAEYLFSVLTTSSMRKKLEGFSLGATLPNLNTSIVENLAIPVPPIAVQDAFTRAIEATESLTSKQSRLLVEQENLCAALQGKVFS